MAKTDRQGNICKVSPTKVPLRLYDVRNQVSSLRKMVGGDNLQRFQITGGDFPKENFHSMERRYKLQYDEDDFFRYNTKLHKKMYKIDTRLTVKLSKEVGIQRR